MLAPGLQVRLASGASKPIVGSVESVTDSELVLTQGTGPQSFPRIQIVSVSVRKEDHRRNALIGLAVGTLAGALMGVAAGRAEPNCPGGSCSVNEAGVTAGGGIVGLVCGTLTGVFWPTGGWHKIYAP